MKKYLWVLALFFLGCNNPIDNVKENQQKITELSHKVEILENKSYKIDELDMKIKTIEEKQKIIQKTIKDNGVISKLASLNKEIQNLKKQSNIPTFDYIVIHPMTLITIKQSNIYSKANKNSKIVKKWPKKTTFTTYKEKNGFVKVTGYFIHNQWVENNKEWWISKKDTTVKRLEK